MFRRFKLICLLPIRVYKGEAMSTISVSVLVILAAVLVTIFTGRICEYLLKKIRNRTGSAANWN